LKALIWKVLHWSVRQLTRVAAALALVALAMMAYSILSPRPLPVVLAMSVGHGIGLAAVACYVLAILLTMRRNAAGVPAQSSLPPPPEEPMENPAPPSPP